MPSDFGSVGDGTAAEGRQPVNEFSSARTLQLPAQHPSLAGHFPGHPILPGSVLLDLVLQALPGPCRHLDQVKFLSPALPGQRLSLEVSSDFDSGLIRFACRRQDRSLVCAGSALLAPPDSR